MYDVHEEAQRDHRRCGRRAPARRERRAEVDQVLVHALHVLAPLVERRAADRPGLLGGLLGLAEARSAMCSRRAGRERRDERAQASRRAAVSDASLLLALRGASAARGTCGAAARAPGGRGARAAPAARPSVASVSLKSGSARERAAICWSMRTSWAFASASCCTTSARSSSSPSPLGDVGQPRRRGSCLRRAARRACGPAPRSRFASLLALGLQSADLVTRAAGILAALREAHVQHDLAVARARGAARAMRVGVGLAAVDPGLASRASASRARRSGARASRTRSAGRGGRAPR